MTARFYPAAVNLDIHQQVKYIVLMDVLLDASAIMAVILNEPNRAKVIGLTEDRTLLSPEIISFEIGNALINLYKRQKITETKLLDAYKTFTGIPIRLINIDIEKALKIACKYKIYAYDAYYLETAYRLNSPLITFDALMKDVGTDLNIRILDGATGKEE